MDIAITSDIILKGAEWDKAMKQIKTTNPNTKDGIMQTIYGVFVVSAAIGIMCDKRIEKYKDGEEEYNVPRLQLSQNISTLELMLTTAVLTSNQLSFSDEKRLEIAFDKGEIEYGKILSGFANFGVTVLNRRIVADKDNVDYFSTMDALKDLFISMINGTYIESSDEYDEAWLESE